MGPVSAAMAALCHPRPLYWLALQQAGLAGFQGWCICLAMRSPEDHETDADDLIRIGTVASVDLAAARCTVTIDEGAVTGPLRWIEGSMGATRSWSPPSIGEQVLVLAPAGETAAAVVLRGLVSQDFPAPDDRAVELIKFSDGAVVSYDAEAHALEITLPAGATLAISASGGVTIDGDVEVTGKLTASDDVIGGGKSLKTHTHGGVQAGGAQTGQPT
jgi:phage baseplate assembly protein V